MVANESVKIFSQDCDTVAHCRISPHPSVLLQVVFSVAFSDF